MEPYEFLATTHPTICQLQHLIAACILDVLPPKPDKGKAAKPHPRYSGNSQLTVRVLRMGANRLHDYADDSGDDDELLVTLNILIDKHRRTKYRFEAELLLSGFIQLDPAILKSNLDQWFGIATKFKAIQLERLHCVLGQSANPQSLPNNNTIKGLLDGLIIDNDYQRLAILADALEEAGCTDQDVLTHCRTGSHTRGCWVVDRLIKTFLP